MTGLSRTQQEILRQIRGYLVDAVPGIRFKVGGKVVESPRMDITISCLPALSQEEMDAVYKAKEMIEGDFPGEPCVFHSRRERGGNVPKTEGQYDWLGPRMWVGENVPLCPDGPRHAFVWPKRGRVHGKITGHCSGCGKTLIATLIPIPKAAFEID